MRSNFVRLAPLVALALAVSAAAAPELRAQAIDISGTWTFQVELDIGGGTPTVTLVQEGDRLTGRYVSEQLGTADLTGTIEGAEFRFTFNASLEGQAVPVTLTGRVESPELLRGTFDLAGMAGGTFTGRPREEP